MPRSPQQQPVLISNTAALTPSFQSHSPDPTPPLFITFFCLCITMLTAGPETSLIATPRGPAPPCSTEAQSWLSSRLSQTQGYSRHELLYSLWKHSPDSVSFQTLWKTPECKTLHQGWMVSTRQAKGSSGAQTPPLPQHGSFPKKRLSVFCSISFQDAPKNGLN